MQSTIRRLADSDIDAVVAFSLAAWVPVFASMESELGPEVSRLVLPDWRSAQASAVEAVCRTKHNDVWVAVIDDRPVGFVAIRYVDEGPTRAGEVYMLAVDPDHQGAGVGTSLAHWAIEQIESLGLDLVVIATGGDPGHASARALYEKLGFNAFRQVRYYRKV